MQDKKQTTKPKRIQNLRLQVPYATRVSTKPQTSNVRFDSCSSFKNQQKFSTVYVTLQAHSQKHTDVSILLNFQVSASRVKWEGSMARNEEIKQGS